MRAVSITTYDNWPKPNYIDPETRGPVLYIVNGIFFSLATTAVGLRIYTRIFVRKWFGIDDAAILAAWFFGVADMSSVFYAYRHFYWDRHMWDANPNTFEPGAKLFMVTKSAWSTASALIRLSIMFSFYRLLNHIGLSRCRWVLHVVTISIVALYISQVLTTIFACVPVRDYWIYPSPGTCINEEYSLTILSALNTFSESTVAALPLPIIFSVDMRRSERIAVSCLLSVGFLVSVVGAARTSFVWKVFSTEDLTWWAAPHWICSEVEICVAMMCACAPALRPLLGRVFGPKLVVREPTHKGHNSYHKTDSSLSTNNLPPGGELPAGSGNYTSYSTYWRTIDVEGIGVDDGFGYTVTITSANLKSARRRGCLRRLLFPPDEDPDFPELALRDSRAAGTNGLPTLPEHPAKAHHQFRSRGSVPMWGLRGFDKDPIEVVARNSLEVVEESRPGYRAERGRGSSEAEEDDSNIMFGVGWSPAPGSPAPPGQMPARRETRGTISPAREREATEKTEARAQARTPDEAAAAHESFFCESDAE